MSSDKIELLFKNSIIDPETGCRIWQKCRDKDGYGVTGFGGKNWRVHRLLYTLFIADIPKGLHVRHLCHNTSCVNPEHLFKGTPQDNEDDKRIANRQAQGEKHGCAKLTEKDVRTMREIRKTGISFQKIANKFGVHKKTAMQAIKGEIWKCVV